MYIYIYIFVVVGLNVRYITIYSSHLPWGFDLLLIFHRASSALSKLLSRVLCLGEVAVVPMCNQCQNVRATIFSEQTQELMCTAPRCDVRGDVRGVH